MATFSVQFEIGPETRALIERIVDRSAIQIELGPRTLETIRQLARRTDRHEERRPTGHGGTAP